MKRPLSFGVLFAVLCALTYGYLVYKRTYPWIGGSDSAGYYNLALLLSEGRMTVPMRMIEGLEPGQAEATFWIYTPLGFAGHATPGHIVPGYPPGLSLLMLATATFTGWLQAPAWTAGWNMLAGVLLFYVLGRRCGLAPGWAGVGTAILGLSPLYLAMGLQPMSDAPACTWCLAALLFTLLSDRHPRWAIMGGFAFAMAVLLRPTNVLLALPAVVALGKNWRSWIYFGLGGLPGGIFQAWFNLHAFGAIFTTGYGNMSGAFSIQWLKPSLLHYGKWLPVLFTPLIALFVIFPLQKIQSWHLRLILLLWAVPVLSLYAFYFCTWDAWWYLRFILPAIPPLLIGALLVAQNGCRRLNWPLFSGKARWGWQGASAVLILGLAWFNMHQAGKLAIWNGKHDDRSYYETSAWLNQHAPANAIVLSMQSTGALFAYTPLTIVRWDCLAPKTSAALVSQAAKNRQPIYAVIYPFEEADTFARVPGRWREIYSYRWAKIWLREELTDTLP